jgi:hypothetical protein
MTTEQVQDYLRGSESTVQRLGEGDDLWASALALRNFFLLLYELENPGAEVDLIDVDWFKVLNEHELH